VTVLPSSAGGAVTKEVGYFDTPAAELADWIVEAFGSGWKARPADWMSLADAVRCLTPSVPLSRYAVVPIDSWALVLNNGPLGTDVGVLPSRTAKTLGCRALRAVCVENDDPGFPARMLALYEPDSPDPSRFVRSIVAANDGGRWVFETAGDPLEFEQIDRYTARRKADRFTSELLYEYLRKLHVPFDQEPDWGRAILVELD